MPYPTKNNRDAKIRPFIDKVFDFVEDSKKQKMILTINPDAYSTEYISTSIRTAIDNQNTDFKEAGSNKRIKCPRIERYGTRLTFIKKKEPKFLFKEGKERL